MLEDEYVLGRIAILGQATAIYAKPNTGKTLVVLHLLTEGITQKTLKAEDVFYVNADDNYRGLVTKLELAERYGFHMVAPGFNGFSSDMFLRYLQEMIENGSAKGKVIILDTLKKFTDLMDKKFASAFMKAGRSFVQHGGTLILLAHTNKNRDAEGKVIFAGTSDIVDDVDCAYTLDLTSDNGTERNILFENIKSRGDVAQQVAYRYRKEGGQSYGQLLGTIEELDEGKASEAKAKRVIAEMLERNSFPIQAITEAMEEGINLKTDLLEAAHKGSGISKAKLSRVLSDHTGTDWNGGHRWKMTKGEKNAKSYHLLTVFSLSKPDPYQAAKDGE